MFDLAANLLIYLKNVNSKFVIEQNCMSIIIKSNSSMKRINNAVEQNNTLTTPIFARLMTAIVFARRHTVQFLFIRMGSLPTLFFSYLFDSELHHLALTRCWRCLRSQLAKLNSIAPLGHPIFIKRTLNYLASVLPTRKFSP